MGYSPGTAFGVSVTVTDDETGLAVDPSTFRFVVLPPETSPYERAEYSWDADTLTWTTTDPDAFGTPSKGVTGVFGLEIVVPFDNNAAGLWAIAWKSEANEDGAGEGSGTSEELIITEAAALG